MWGVISVVAIIIFSYSFFFYLQNRTEIDVRKGLFEEQKDRQLESTKSLSQHIGSDLDKVISMLYAMSNSRYLQIGDFTGSQAHSFLEESYAKIANVVDTLFILDKDDIISASLSGRGSESFASVDLSLREWVRETKESGMPVLSNGFERLGVYSVFITHPIVNRETNEYMGLVGVSLPTVDFFEKYGNVHDINSPFIAAYDKRGILLAVGAGEDLIGKGFFGDYVQNFVNHNVVLNNLTRSLLSGNSGYAVYDYGSGERLTTQYPVIVNGVPTYFIQVITPTSTVYSHIDGILLEKRSGEFALLAGVVAAVAVLIFLLVRWNRILESEVRVRTVQLDKTNEGLERANEQLRRHDKLQKEFINTAAHELRTPIQPILGLSDLLSSQIKDPKQIGIMKVISRNAKRLHRLAEDMLDVSKIESDSLTLKRSQFNLTSLIQDVIKEYRAQDKGTRNLTVISNGSTNDVLVQADKHRITRVITNLLNNALKFTNEDGSIIVSIEKERNGKMSADEYALVRIKDTGEGIDPAFMPRLFTKFATDSNVGTGLGLFICKSIIEAHGGRIWAENNMQERGASFFFTLPVVTMTTSVAQQQRQ
jgi:signal transduction histidine kinase